MNDRIKTVCLNGCFYPLFLVVSLVAIPLLSFSVAGCAPFRSRRATMRSFRRMIARYGRMMLACTGPLVRIRVETAGPPIPQPCIYVCNHRSASDPFLMALLPGEIIQVVNIWPFHIPVFGWYAKWAGYLSVREMPFDEFLEITRQRLAEGCSIAAFPEGTRSGAGPMGPFHGAIFRVAQAARVPVVPVCITGNERIPPKGSGILHPGPIRIRILAPILPETDQVSSPFAFKQRVRQLISQTLAQMEQPS